MGGWNLSKENHPNIKKTKLLRLELWVRKYPFLTAIFGNVISSLSSFFINIAAIYVAKKLGENYEYPHPSIKTHKFVSSVTSCRQVTKPSGRCCPQIAFCRHPR